MKTSALTIVIPGEIVALPDLALAERVVLARINEFPGCSNGHLARLLGITQRGIESMLQRLRQRGVIEQIGKGRARQHRLKFYVEPHTNCEKNDDAESHTLCAEESTIDSRNSCVPDAAPDPGQPAPAPTQVAAPTKLEVTPAKVVEREIESALDCVGRWDFKGALGHYRSIREIIAQLPDRLPEVKAEALATVIEDETRVLAFELVFRYSRATNMPYTKRNALFAAIKGLTKEKIVQIRPALDAQVQLGTPADICALLAN